MGKANGDSKQDEAKLQFATLLARLRTFAESELERERGARRAKQLEMEAMIAEFEKLKDAYAPQLDSETLELLDHYQKTLGDAGGLIIRSLKR